MDNFILKKDNLLTKDECDKIIKWTRDNHTFTEGGGNCGYKFCELMDYGGSFRDSLSPRSLHPIKDVILTLLKSYEEKYPECTRTDHWELEHIRFQWWEPGNFFNGFHSEHMKSEPYRVLVFLIYLSDNDCSTLFTRYEDVENKAGRAILFPSYFTHEHSGSPCKKGLDKYALTGYFSFT
tara:strand:+ start:104 stop:643 length:540 start_codon:yes stop_codon:yes gene_type:complete